MEKFAGKTVAVTGACGTVGAELVRQLAESGASKVVCLDNNESDLFFLKEQYRSQPHVNCHLADVRDLESLKLRLQGVDIVLHAAALKHVVLCEDSPNQAVRTNINGTQNVIDAAFASNVERVIFTSTDKAVNPTNVMGTSKLMGERLITAASESYRNTSTILASTRFGNVLGSRGSVVPLFKRQIDSGGPITLTDREMTRFVMTLEEAATLVLKSVWLATGGEVFVTKMPVARIEDIALVMREELGNSSIEINEIGAKPGEKMYEELMNDEEVRRTFEVDDYFVVLPAFAEDFEGSFPLVKDHSQPDRPYNSATETVMTLDDVREFFRSRRILEEL